MNLYRQSPRLFTDLGAAITVRQAKQSSTPCMNETSQSSTPCMNETSHVRTDLIVNSATTYIECTVYTRKYLISE
jgi:hypothetical protein